MPKPEHVFEWDCELYVAGFLPTRKDSVLETEFGNGKPRVIELSKEDDFLRNWLGLALNRQFTMEQKNAARIVLSSTNLRYCKS